MIHSSSLILTGWLLLGSAPALSALGIPNLFDNRDRDQNESSSEVSRALLSQVGEALEVEAERMVDEVVSDPRIERVLRLATQLKLPVESPIAVNKNKKGEAVAALPVAPARAQLSSRKNFHELFVIVSDETLERQLDVNSCWAAGSLMELRHSGRAVDISQSSLVADSLERQGKIELAQQVRLRGDAAVSELNRPALGPDGHNRPYQGVNLAQDQLWVHQALAQEGYDLPYTAIVDRRIRLIDELKENWKEEPILIAEVIEEFFQPVMSSDELIETLSRGDLALAGIIIEDPATGDQFGHIIVIRGVHYTGRGEDSGGSGGFMGAVGKATSGVKSLFRNNAEPSGPLPARSQFALERVYYSDPAETGSLLGHETLLEDEGPGYDPSEFFERMTAEEFLEQVVFVTSAEHSARVISRLKDTTFLTSR